MQRALAILALMVVGAAAIAEIETVAPHIAQNSDEPGWRRTAQGWVKVGPLGDAAFVRPSRTPVTRGLLHPLLLSGFVTFASLLALFAHDWVSPAPCPSTCDKPGDRAGLRPHFHREMVIR